MSGPSTIGSSANGPPPHGFAAGRKFGEQAAMLAGVAMRLVGWRPDEFWRATPAELAAALDDGLVEPVAGDELRRLREQFPDG
jgi:uncharacterized phage protein (TIGR02216 family)